MKLTAEAVRKIVLDVLYKPEELPDPTEAPDGAVIAEGVVGKYGFHPDRLKSHEGEIVELLKELPDAFRKSAGGGWSFLNACMDREGSQWGEQRDVDSLLCLGIAIGKAEIQLDRSMWNLFPGGMPYFSVDVS